VVKKIVVKLTFVALPALDVLGRTLLGAIDSAVARLTAVLAGVLVNARLRTITEAMPFLLAIIALEVGFIFELDFVLRTIL